MRPNSGGVGEAYSTDEYYQPLAGSTSTNYDQGGAAASSSGHQFSGTTQHYDSYYDGNNNNVLDQSDLSGSNTTPQTAHGGGGAGLGGGTSSGRRRNNNSTSSPTAVISSSYAIQTIDDSNRESLYSDGTSYYGPATSRAIYDEAQFRSSTRSGGILHRSGNSGNSGSGGVSSSAQQSSSYQRSMNGSGFSGSGEHAPTSLTASSNSYSRIFPGSVSSSGNLLVHVQIQEDADIELDRDEIKELANATKDKEEEEELLYLQNNNNNNNGGRNNNNDTSTIGTTKSTQKSLDDSQHQYNGRGGNQLYVVDSNPNNAILHLNNNNGDHGDIDQARQKMKAILFSPPFRRMLFLGICFVLIVLGVLLTMENFMRVKTARDWMEPHSRDKMLWYNQGGLDWTFGSDAPKPQAGAYIEYSVENHIADWAHGTSRIPPPVTTNTDDSDKGGSLDGYGTVALSETVMFKDIPLFWGLPFAGGSILENTLGQCLNLVQASNGKGMDKDKDGSHVGNALQLSTVFVMGKKYLNVDLSTAEGIERASALALATSGMADVVYSPLLHEVSELFSTMNQGRLFIMVRHPVDREFARFRYLRYQRRYDHGKLLLSEADKDMTYAEFAHSDYVADNWMTRTLVRKDEGVELTARDMHTAKEILRRKALVGLYSDMIGAVRHYARYFGWDNAMNGGKFNKSILSCFESAILDGMGKDMYDAMDLDAAETQEGSIAWRKIMETNRFDLELYVYSQQLYKFQIALS